MMLMFNRMWKHLRPPAWTAVFSMVLGAAVCFAQSAPPTLPSNTVYGRLGGGTSGPGQAIPFATLLAQLGSTAGPNTGFITVPGVGLIPVVGAGGVNLYASPTGSDTNNYCLNSGTPCTLKGACTIRTQFATYLSNGFNINLANGTYSALDSNNALCTVIGNSGGSSSALTNIIGTSTSGSPTNTVLSVPASDLGVYVKDGGEVDIQNIEFTGGNGSTGISCSGQGSVCDYQNVFWGAWGTSGAHISGNPGAYINLVGTGETLLANYVYHWNFSGNVALNAGATTSIPSAVATAAGNFLNAAGPAFINLGGWTLSGSGVSGSTGTRANLVGPGYLVTPSNATCNATFPGNQNCVIVAGFQDSAGDPTALPGTVYASLPGTIVGYQAYITDGKSSNCGDSACTTWGTTVTGGGGSLKLNLWSNGSNWTLVGK